MASKARGPIRLVKVAQEELKAVQKFLKRLRGGQEENEFFTTAHFEGARTECLPVNSGIGSGH